MKIVDWILNNKQWLFDGIGIVILGWFFRAGYLMWHRRRSKAKKESHAGRGGNAEVLGDGMAMGGKGGDSPGEGWIAGDGGNAKVVGGGTAIGGQGGAAAAPEMALGGAAGSVESLHGEFVMGGEGGEGGQLGRGGRGGRSPLEVMGVPNRQLPDGSWLWDYGRGGDGGYSSPTGSANSPNPS